MGRSLAKNSCVFFWLFNSKRSENYKIVKRLFMSLVHLHRTEMNAISNIKNVYGVDCKLRGYSMVLIDWYRGTKCMQLPHLKAATSHNTWEIEPRDTIQIAKQTMTNAASLHAIPHLTRKIDWGWQPNSNTEGGHRNEVNEHKQERRNWLLYGDVPGIIIWKNKKVR